MGIQHALAQIRKSPPPLPKKRKKKKTMVFLVVELRICVPVYPVVVSASQSLRLWNARHIN